MIIVWRFSALELIVETFYILQGQYFVKRVPRPSASMLRFTRSVTDWMYIWMSVWMSDYVQYGWQTDYDWLTDWPSWYSVRTSADRLWQQARVTAATQCSLSWNKFVFVSKTIVYSTVQA